MILWNEDCTKSLGDLERVDHDSDPTLHKWIFVPDPDATEEEISSAFRCWENAGIQLNVWEKKMSAERAENIYRAIIGD